MSNNAIKLKLNILFENKGKVFVREWAKFRFGVFEEYGYPGDEQYPLFYWDEKFVDGGISYDLTPNFCTDVPLKGYRELVN